MDSSIRPEQTTLGTNVGPLRLATQDLPMLSMQESEVNFGGFPSSSAGRVNGAHGEEWEVTSDTGKEVGKNV